MTFVVFKRSWWRKEGGQWVPHMGRRRVVRRGIPTREEARRICEEGNKDLPASNRAGLKYEFDTE